MTAREWRDGTDSEARIRRSVTDLRRVDIHLSATINSHGFRVADCSQKKSRDRRFRSAWGWSS